MKNRFFLHPDPKCHLRFSTVPHPDPLVRGTDPRIRIRTKMSPGTLILGEFCFFIT
jgi:hypothetical protein